MTLLLAMFVPASLLGAAAPVFESGQVRPLALSPDGRRLLAVNTPDAHVELFDVAPEGLRHTASVPVGLEPVAVAWRTDDEAWVVNHLSDSVSVVRMSPAPPRVVRTLLVGDEPGDVVFAGPGRGFVTAARRGQSRPGDAALTAPGVGRADLWVFDAGNLDAPPHVVTLFGDTPRALAASPDGESVYVAVFRSGNRTTTVPERLVCDGGPAALPCTVGGVVLPGGLPGPITNVQDIPGPETGLIVRADPVSGAWRDGLGRSWDGAIGFTLPDIDVFRVDAATLAPTAQYAGVGTVLFGLAVNPVSGAVYVSNTEARNEIRFEGPGLHGGSSVRGRLHEARVTVLRGTAVLPRHLNPHIDYAVVPSPPGVKERSLALPLGMAVSADGATLWLAAFGSGVIVRLDTAALEAGDLVPDVVDHVAVSGGGPSGVVLDEPRGRLYVLTRFDNAVSVVDVETRRETAHLPLWNPEPPEVVAGRPFLYDARATSSNGEATCASCHVFGDVDGLAWDLGNPDAPVVPNPNPVHLGEPQAFHPLKGPMMTQSLRGLAHHGPMHWRGDRTGGAVPGGDPLAEDQAFSQFLIAFESLLGREAPIADADMRRFGDFVLHLAYPPSPVRALDGTPTPEEAAGGTLFFGRVTDQAFSCAGCHTLAPRTGHFGSDGQSALQGGPQLFKIPHLRNLYQKVGMFGAGAQVRGFGFTHDGSVPTLAEFLASPLFTLDARERHDLERYLLAFDTGLAPIVGQQATLTALNADDMRPRIGLLAARAAAGECDLTVKSVLGGSSRGWLFTGGTFVGDRAAGAPLAEGALRGAVRGPEDVATYLCAPPGSGVRLALDRDDDGFLDGDEADAGSDAADPTSTPRGSPLALARRTIRTSALRMRAIRSGVRLAFASRTRRDLATHRIVPPVPETVLDPVRFGAALHAYGAGFTRDSARMVLPAEGWRRVGSSQRPVGYRYRGPGAGGGTMAVTLTRDWLRIRGNMAYTLDEPAQGRVAVRLVPGLVDGGGWCAAATARPRGRRASTARSDAPGRFVGAPGTAEDCPPPP